MASPCVLLLHLLCRQESIRELCSALGVMAQVMQLCRGSKQGRVLALCSGEGLTLGVLLFLPCTPRHLYV